VARVTESTRAPRASRPSRADRYVALALAASAAALYLATLCRSIYWYDSAEYVTAAHNLGVPHPPGYPLYTLIAHVFTLLPLSPALAVNAMSAAFACVAVVLCYATARSLGASASAAAGAAALLGTGPSFWLNATIAEVYAPGLCCVFGVLLLLLHAQERAQPRLAVLAAGLAGAGLGIHYSLATMGLGFVWLAAQPALAAAGRKRSGDVARQLARCAFAAALGYFVVFAYVVLRADSDVVPNQAHPQSWQRLLWLLSGGNYRLWFTHDQPLAARAAHVLGLIAHELSLPGALLALLGLLAVARTARMRALALCLCVLGNVAFFIRYRVEDLEVFLLPSAGLLAVCAGLGAQALAERLARLLTKIPRAPLAVFAPLLLLGLAAQRAHNGYPARDLHAFTAAQDYGERLAVQLPYRAVILNYTTPAEWKYDAVFGMYFQQVLERRRDVVVASHLDRPLLDRLLAEERSVYLYAPVAHVAAEYELRVEGDLYRVLRRR
jgi:hypothetical protein